jgi:hypothetical protein
LRDDVTFGVDYLQEIHKKKQDDVISFDTTTENTQRDTGVLESTKTGGSITIRNCDALVPESSHAPHGTSTTTTSSEAITTHVPESPSDWGDCLQYSHS